MTSRNDGNQAHQIRRKRDKAYEAHKAVPTEVNGVLVRSRLEALWIEELTGCESFKCIECVLVPIWIDGPFGRFLSNYRPDLVIETKSGERILVELKPTHELAMDDDRQKRALKLNPKYRMIVLGGYPYSKRGVTVRMLTGEREIAHKNISVCEVLRFLGCDCRP